jgi:hypothetical protein
MAQTVILRNEQSKQTAHQLIDAAPFGSVASVKAATRSTDQNDLMWSLLSEISRAKPDGRRHTTEVWKALAMHACGHAVQFETGLSGEPFPIGFRSSRLSKQQMSELIEFLYAYGAEKGVVFKESA